MGVNERQHGASLDENERQTKSRSWAQLQKSSRCVRRQRSQSQSQRRRSQSQLGQREVPQSRCLDVNRTGSTRPERLSLSTRLVLGTQLSFVSRRSTTRA